MSNYLEDIFTLLDRRLEIADEVRRANAEIRNYLTAHFVALLRDHKFENALHGHLPGDAASQARVKIVLERIMEITKE